MDPDRIVTLTDAALLAGCSRKSLERRVERGSLAVTHDAQGRRAVRVADLMRAGIVALMPAGAGSGVDAVRVAVVEGEADALRAALAATEAALRRARDEVQVLRRRATEADTRAAVAEDELTRLLLGAAREPIRQEPRRGRLRLRST
jgi:hypothetical protein